MATPTPITWKNVPGGGSSSSVDAAVQPYGILNSGLSSGFEQLSNVLNQYKKGEMGAAEDALMAQLGQYTTPEQMAQAQASGAIAGAVNNRWVDAADATRAIESRLSGLQTQARSAQEYSDYTDAVASRHHFENISRMGALGDVAGINAYLAENPDVRGLPNHTQKVLDSVHSTQSNLANIASAEARALVDTMTAEELQQQINDRALVDQERRNIFERNQRQAANFGALNATQEEVLKWLGDSAKFDEHGYVDIAASLAANEQAVLGNRRAYSEANAAQTIYNNMRNGLDDSEKAKQTIQEFNNPDSFQDITPVALQDNMSGEISATELLNHRLRNTDPTDPTPRSLPEWPGQIPELMELITPDADLMKRYNYLYGISGPGADTRATQEYIGDLLGDGVSFSVIDRIMAGSGGGITGAPADPSGIDLANQNAQEARLLATEDEILKGNQNEILKRLSTAVESNGLLKDNDTGQQKVVNEAIKLANKERTIIGTDGEEITYFLPEEVLETVLRTMPVDWRYSKAKEFRRALENWEKVNMDRILKGAFTREEVLKERNHRRRLEELNNRSSNG